MKLSDIPKIRLANQKISQSKFTKPEEVVKYLGAVQSQDFFGAKWALGLRLPDSKDSEIEKAFNAGKILRTHALRPTWHFVDPSDIRWMVKLNAPQVKKIMSYYNKKLELSEELFEKTNKIIQTALKDKKHLTRHEIKKELAKYKITGDTQRLGHIVGWAELDGIICSGPKRSKQFTYALIDDVVPKTKPISRDESLVKLAEIFFKTRGPATIQDFSKWSGLSMLDSKNTLEEIKSKLQKETIEEKEYFFPQIPNTKYQIPSALLLPNYDEYISSYADYSIITESTYRKDSNPRLDIMFWNYIIINGFIVGSWRRIFKPKSMDMQISLLRPLTKEEKLGLEKEISKLEKFSELKINVSY